MLLQMASQIKALCPLSLITAWIVAPKPIRYNS